MIPISAFYQLVSTLICTLHHTNLYYRTLHHVHGKVLMLKKRKCDSPHYHLTIKKLILQEHFQLHVPYIIYCG